MKGDVRLYIQRMKSAHEVTTDDELAAKIGRAKQTIASWRARGGIPTDVVSEMTKKFGPSFADLYGPDRIKDEDYVIAGTIFVFWKFLSENSISSDQLLTIGAAFEEVKGVVAAKLMVSTAFDRSVDRFDFTAILDEEIGRDPSYHYPIKWALQAKGK